MDAWGQGVHMIFDGDFTEPWGPDETRESRFCFIGKNLDRNQARDSALSGLLRFVWARHCVEMRLAARR